jgi:hypothetical protein
MKVQNTKNITNHKLKCLIGGFSGAGKTTLAGTIEGPTLVISAEGGLLSIADNDVDYVDLQTSEDGKVLTSATDRIKRLEDIFKWLYNGTKYNSIFLDSLSEMGELLVAKCQKEFPDRKDSFPMWGEYSKLMRSMIKNFRDLPYHVYMTCITDIEKDQNGKRYMSFDIPGSISEKLPQYFDEVFYIMAAEDGKRKLYTKATDTLRHAKDRSNKLDSVEEPNLADIVIKILGGK